MNAKSKVILGIAGAAAAGVIIGLLLAPDKGVDTRQRIKKTANDWSGQLSDLFASAKEELNHLQQKGAKMANDAANHYNKAKETYS